MPRYAFITGCAGTALDDGERRFLRDAQPWGLILFARNVADRAQIRALVDDFRECVGRADAPVLIDQEGGRIQRLKPPQWPAYPAAGEIGALYARDGRAGRRAAWLAARLTGEDLAEVGINVDCLPVLDLRLEGAHGIIGDRAYGGDPEAVIDLARAAAIGLAAAGVAPVVKHIPGHGRARVDSHDALPVVDEAHETLSASDFVPFRALADLPMAMTAHVVYAAIDDGAPATLSRRMVGDIMRGEIGFDGLIMTDDLSMGALAGPMGDRVSAAMRAGCDMALHCNGDMGEMREVAGCAPGLNGEAARRADAALRFAAREDIDIPAARAELADLLGSKAR